MTSDLSRLFSFLSNTPLVAWFNNLNYLTNSLFKDIRLVEFLVELSPWLLHVDFVVFCEIFLLEGI